MFKKVYFSRFFERRKWKTGIALRKCDAIIQSNLEIFSAIANELRTMLQEKIVKEEMIFIQPHIKLMCDLLAVMFI